MYDSKLGSNNPTGLPAGLFRAENPLLLSGGVNFCGELHPKLKLRRVLGSYL